MAFTDSFLIQTAVQVFMGARPEILIFIFAIFAHALLFKGLRLPLKPKRSDNDTQSKATSDENATQREVEVSNPFRSPEVIELEQQQATQLRKLVSEQRLDEALAALESYPRKTVFLYNAILDACIENQDEKAARRIMDKAIAAGMTDVVTHNMIVKLHCQKGDVHGAEQAMQDMRSSGTPPNGVTYNELLDGIIRTEPQRAWAIVDDMRANRCAPTGVTCSTLLKGVGKGSKATDLDRVLQLLTQIDDDADEVLFGSIIEACVRTGRTDLLCQQLKRHRWRRRVLVTDVHTFGSLIRAYGVVADIDAAWDTWRQMRANKILPTSITLGCMVEALASNDQVQAAYDLMRDCFNNEEIRPVVNSVVCCSVLKGFCNERKFDRAFALYEEMLAEKIEISIVCFNVLVDTCVRSSEMGRIEGLLKAMTNQGIEPNVITYSTILKGYCLDGRLDKAFKILEDMKKSTQVSPDEITYNTLIDGCARNCLWDRGMLLLKEMEDAGVQPSNFTLAVLVKLANRSKRFEQAFELCKDLSQTYNFRLNVHVYNNLMQACTGSNQMQRALKIFGDVFENGIQPDSRSYTILLRGCVSHGMRHDAAGLLRAAFGLRGAHVQVGKFKPSLLRPKGGLSPNIVCEILEGIAKQCGDQALAQLLFNDLRQVPGSRLDQKVLHFLSR